MKIRERIIRIIGAVILFAIAIIALNSCAPHTCPTYNNAIRAKHQKNMQRFDGANSNFCHPQKKDRKIVTSF
jgi:hypothetical protein